MAGEMNRLDRLINYLSPQAFCRRMAWREEARYYTAARTDRFGANWFPPGKLSAEETDSPYRALIRARARDLERNNGIVRGVLDVMERNIIGLGIIPQASVTSRGGALMERLNRQLGELWNDWSTRANCDVAGSMSFAEFQKLYLRRMIVDGDVFLLMTTPPEGLGYPFALQAVEADLLAEDMIECQGHKVYGGVEVDDYMKPIAYHFRMDPLTYRKAIRVPAERVIHGYRKTRAPQTRGISELAGIMESLRDLGEYVDAELKAARIAGSATGVVKTDGGAQTIGRVARKTSNGTPIEEIQIGALNYLKPGEEAAFPVPGRPNQAAGGFIAVIMRFIGVGLGLSYEAVSRDLSQVNYSSIREGRLQDIKTYEERQQDLIDSFCKPIYNAWLESMVLNGFIQIPGFWSDRKRYESARWIRPGWSWVDPQKEANAAEKSLSLGTTTLQEVCGYEGKDWQDVLRQRKAEQDFVEELGVKLGSTDGGGDNSANTDNADGAAAPGANEKTSVTGDNASEDG